MIQVNLKHGRSAEEKRRLAADIAKVTCENLKVTPDHVWIQFIDMLPEDFATGDALLADKK
jgi:phenylpyruvate tautomerase PptA (4-oxalocrotonate tautomerase family)